MKPLRRNFIVKSVAALGSVSLFPLISQAEQPETDVPTDNPRGLPHYEWSRPPKIESRLFITERNLVRLPG